MPMIVGEMLKYYYYEHNAESTFSSICDALDFLVDENPAGYPYDDLKGMYKSKVADLLFNMFTGMRLGSLWRGRQTVTGGYIFAQSDGDVAACHADKSNEFKDFLLNNLSFESPSAKRHKYMGIEKEDGEYCLKLNMQLRFYKHK